MRRFCPVIEITHTFDKSILIGQTLETENISFVKSDGIITQTGVQRISLKLVNRLVHTKQSVKI